METTANSPNLRTTDCLFVSFGFLLASITLFGRVGMAWHVSGQSVRSPVVGTYWMSQLTQMLLPQAVEVSIAQRERVLARH